MAEPLTSLQELSALVPCFSLVTCFLSILNKVALSLVKEIRTNFLQSLIFPCSLFTELP